MRFSKFGIEKALSINYGCNEKEIRVLELNDDLKLAEVFSCLVFLFHSSYFDTNFDTKTFSKEFYNVVDLLIQGIVPLELEYLAVDEIEGEIEDILNRV